MDRKQEDLIFYFENAYVSTLLKYIELINQCDNADEFKELSHFLVSLNGMGVQDENEE